ncbi:MAG TPA: PH domain-containing protein [Phycisphaerales bacterium]|nr:PH domain-containing protein [Phycisphaerales bacterium]
MASRYIVHGKNASNGQTVQKVIEASSAKEAEEIATRIGVQVLGSEIESDPAARPPASGVGTMGLRGTLPDTPEEPVWEGNPSQWTNFGWYVGCILIIPIPFAIYHYLRTRTTRYVLTNQRLRLETGIVARSIEEVELYRMNDSAVRQSFIERLLGVGTVWLQTSDERNPEITLRAVPNPAGLREDIRKHAEARRRWRRVAEIELQ